MSTTPPRLRAAFVRRVHGVQGEVKVESTGGDVARFHRGLCLETEPGQRRLTVRSARDGGEGTVLLAFDNVTTPEDAASLCGMYLTVSTATARGLGGDEWFVWQLRGLQVRTALGEHLGVVDDVESGVANDVLVVRRDADVLRLPMVRAFVQRVDIDAGVIVVVPQAEEQA
ncbi:MAG: 16S rRNA processing protein RimM [Candidatus Dormibacteraeota bacterium]|nr:16S rRNA processing protein RimM [Candidatus Dormibacteraeota bacterium]